MSTRPLLLATALLFLARACPGQQPAVIPADKVPQYDVVTVKPNKTGSGSSGIDSNDGIIKIENYSLKGLIAEAYNVKRDQVFDLPPWTSQVRYDIQAKVLEPDVKVLDALTRQQRRSMLRPILTDRFQMKAHIETRTLPIYELTLVKDKPKFAESSHADKFNGVGDGGISVMNTHLVGHGVTLDGVLDHLSNEVHRPILNKTGLSGKYDFDLTWARDDMAVNADTPDAPSLFTALQEQLGLRLVSTKGPVDVVVIDSIAPPSEN